MHSCAEWVKQSLSFILLCFSLWAAISYIPWSKSLLLALISCITSNVTAVPLVSTWWLLLTLSLRHLQGGNPIWWLRQGTQTFSHQTPPGGTPPELLWAPGRHRTKPTLFQQICSGVGVGRRSSAPPYHFPWACANPRVRRPLNPKCHRVCLITVVVAPGVSVGGVRVRVRKCVLLDIACLVCSIPWFYPRDVSFCTEKMN